MPLYEFKCRNCSDVFNLLRRTRYRDGIVVCPTCGFDKTIRNPAAEFVHPRRIVPGLEANTDMPTVHMSNIRIDNCGMGMDIEGYRVIGNGVSINRCPTGIRGRRSDLNFNGLTIDGRPTQR